MGNSLRRGAAVVATGLLALLTISASAQAADGGNFDGNPVNCSNNWNVGAAVPVVARDGRVIGYSQMRWSDTCQGNWTRAWTVSGQPTTMESTIAQGIPPSPTRRFAVASDYSSSHFTMYVRAGTTEKMCGSTKMWDVTTVDWAFTAGGVYCRT